MFLVFLSTCDAGNVIGYSILFGIGMGNGELLRTTNRWIDTTGRTQFQESTQAYFHSNHETDYNELHSSTYINCLEIAASTF